MKKVLLALTMALTLTACSDEEPTFMDIVAPVVTMNGDSSINLEYAEAYVELGATAEDETDGTVSVDILGTVDSDTAGSYQIVYKAQDAAGNITQVTRDVVVADEPVPVDTTPPVITLVGGDTTYPADGVYVEPGFSASDDTDGDISGLVIVTMEVLGFEGDRTYSYNVFDAAGNVAVTMTRTVGIEEIEPDVEAHWSDDTEYTPDSPEVLKGPVWVDGAKVLGDDGKPVIEANGKLKYKFKVNGCNDIIYFVIDGNSTELQAVQVPGIPTGTAIYYVNYQSDVKISTKAYVDSKSVNSILNCCVLDAPSNFERQQMNSAHNFELDLLKAVKNYGVSVVAKPYDVVGL